MEKQKMRLDMLYSHEFFKERPGIAESLVLLEEEIGEGLPSAFDVHFMPDYTIGDAGTGMRLGRLYKYHVFGLETQQGWVYKAFESKLKMKWYFTSLPNLEKNDLAYLLKEIDEIE